MKTIESHVA